MQPPAHHPRTVSLLALVLLAGLALAGCGGSDDGGPAAGDGTAAPSATQPTSADAASTSASTAVANADANADDEVSDDDGGGVVIAGGEVRVNGSVVVSGGTVSGGGTGDAIVGSGVVVTESRPLSGFHAVEVRSAGSVEVRMGQSETVEVEADDNVLASIRTEVVDGRLVISLAPGTSLRDVTMRVRVQAVQLDAVTGAGSADISVEGLAVPTLALSLQGSGDARLRGTASSLTIDVDGSSDVEAADLVAEAATVRVAGSGDVEVHATASLSAAIEGSGDITYHGAPPTITTDVDGSGDVEPA